MQMCKFCLYIFLKVHTSFGKDDSPILCDSYYILRLIVDILNQSWKKWGARGACSRNTQGFSQEHMTQELKNKNI